MGFPYAVFFCCCCCIFWARVVMLLAGFLTHAILFSAELVHLECKMSLKRLIQQRGNANCVGYCLSSNYSPSLEPIDGPPLDNQRSQMFSDPIGRLSKDCKQVLLTLELCRILFVLPIKDIFLSFPFLANQK